MREFLNQLLQVSLDAGPWLLLGLIVAGLIKVLIPTRWLNRWLGGPGIMPMVNAALLGTPLPLCSCSVVPVALSVRRSGASKGATTSFLIATPENGADSIALSYALLGPVLMVARPIAAIVIAIATGFSVSWFVSDDEMPVSETGASESDKPKSCCEDQKSVSKPAPEPTPASKESCCCSKGESTCATNKGINWKQMIGEFNGAVMRLFDDIAFWLAIGLVLAALINTLISEGQIASWGSGLPAMVMMVLVGIPMYICATASTPVAASLLIAGVSPGTVLVFLLAGPATNMGTIGIIRKELGMKTASIYLTGVAVGSIAFGLLLDQCINQFEMEALAQHAHEHGQMLPSWLSYGSMLLVGLGMLIKAIKFTRAKLTRKRPASCCDSDR